MPMSAINKLIDNQILFDINPAYHFEHFYYFRLDQSLNLSIQIAEDITYELNANQLRNINKVYAGKYGESTINVAPKIKYTTNIEWIIGFPFMFRYCLSFDYANLSIGFAELDDKVSE